jgi:hypothetical protein
MGATVYGNFYLSHDLFQQCDKKRKSAVAGQSAPAERDITELWLLSASCWFFA